MNRGLQLSKQLTSKLNLGTQYKVQRYIQTNRSLLARNKGSLFGWDLFGKKEETKVEEKEIVDTADWAEVKQVEVESQTKELSKEEVQEIVLTQVKKYHPLAKDNVELNELSLEDGKIKFEVLSNIVKELKLQSQSIEYELPNRNLNNISTIKDVLDFYLLEKDKFDVMQGHGIENFIKKEIENNNLPNNVSFEVAETEIKNEVQFNKKGKQLNAKLLNYIRKSNPKPSRH